MSLVTETEIHKDLNNDETYFAVDVVSNEEWLERVRNAQGEDPRTSLALEQWAEKHGILLGRFKHQRNIHLQKDILMRGKQIVLPIALRYEVVEAYHNQIGHLGAARTVSAVAENYTWSGMQSYISDCSANCQICIQNKTSHSAKEPLQPYELDDIKSRSMITFDVAALPWATQQHRYFLVIVDLFSKYLELVAMKDEHATTIKSAILGVWVHHQPW